MDRLMQQASKLQWVPARTSSICSRHFDASQYRILPSKRRKLIDFAVPTLFLFEKVSKFSI